MGLLAICCCCSCWIFGGRLPSDDGILARDRDEAMEDKEKKEKGAEQAAELPLLPGGGDNFMMIWT
jgi:hypothetical protein